MNKFNNKLTKKVNGTPHTQNFVSNPLNGSKFLIFVDSILFCYPQKQSKKDRNKFIAVVPNLEI